MLHPPIRPPCILQSPASVLRTTEPVLHVQTRRQRGLASCRIRGTRRGRDNSSVRNLASVLRPRCLGITGPARHRISPRPNTEPVGGQSRSPGLAADFCSKQKFLALFLALPSSFSFGLSLLRLVGFCLPLIRASASQSTSRKHARPIRNSSRQ